MPCEPSFEKGTTFIIPLLCLDSCFNTILCPFCSTEGDGQSWEVFPSFPKVWVKQLFTAWQNRSSSITHALALSEWCPVWLFEDYKASGTLTCNYYYNKTLPVFNTYSRRNSTSPSPRKTLLCTNCQPQEASTQLPPLTFLNRCFLWHAWNTPRFGPLHSQLVQATVPESWHQCRKHLASTTQSIFVRGSNNSASADCRCGSMAGHSSKQRQLRLAHPQLQMQQTLPADQRSPNPGFFHSYQEKSCHALHEPTPSIILLQLHHLLLRLKVPRKMTGDVGIQKKSLCILSRLWVTPSPVHHQYYWLGHSPKRQAPAVKMDHSWAEASQT